jgi:hypothetical protein
VVAHAGASATAWRIRNPAVRPLERASGYIGRHQAGAAQVALAVRSGCKPRRRVGPALATAVGNCLSWQDQQPPAMRSILASRPIFHAPNPPLHAACRPAFHPSINPRRHRPPIAHRSPREATTRTSSVGISPPQPYKPLFLRRKKHSREAGSEVAFSAQPLPSVNALPMTTYLNARIRRRLPTPCVFENGRNICIVIGPVEDLTASSGYSCRFFYQAAFCSRRFFAGMERAAQKSAALCQKIRQ